jgi:hypothetical protein
MTGSAIDRLIEDSINGRLLGQSRDWLTASFDETQAQEAAGQITARPDASSYHLLLTLRRAAPTAYAAIAPEVRARVLIDALRSASYLNDWGHLGPGGGHDGPAAQALLDTGDAAIGPLRELLDDDRPARLMGSESATISSQYGYRHSDYAYRYLRLVRGEDPDFEAEPAQRDAAHERLAASLGAAG